MALIVVPPVVNLSGGLNETFPVITEQLTVPGALPENFVAAEAGPLVATAIKASGITATTPDNKTFLPILIPIVFPLRRLWLVTAMSRHACPNDLLGHA